MLQCADQIRLTGEERRLLGKFTGAPVPAGLDTAAALNAYLDAEIAGFGDATPEGKLLGQLLEDFRA